jgi:Tol biopolymer transport system component
MARDRISGLAGSGARMAGGALAALLCSASVSADIVFSALEDGTWRLYHQADLHAAPKPVDTAEISGDAGAARLSPDAAQVAFEVTGGGVHICPLHQDAGCRSLLQAQGDAVRPVWMPAGDGLVFTDFDFQAGEEVSTLRRADADLTRVEPVIQQTGIQDFPDLSPDASRLAYTSWLTLMPYRGGVRVVQQLWTLDLTRGQAGQLLLSNASDIHPRWSPDGTRLAFSSNRTGRYEIFTVGADGTDLTRVTDGPGEKTWPAWSPDGERILFTHVQEGHSGLSVVSMDNGAILPHQPFGPSSPVQLRDADWR